MTAPSAELLVDAFGRVVEAVEAAVSGLDGTELAWRPDPDANSIAWLVWHLTRVQDDHVADVAGVPQVWTAEKHAERFALGLDLADTGYGHTSDQVAAVTADAETLLAYHRAVHAATVRFVGGVVDADLDRVVDERWDPPVTLGVRLVSVIADDLQHAGQAAYLRGLLERGTWPGAAAR
ncbi:MAG: DUF664 domain-containing protein [Actinomycetota bacterium]|nr:DUF664 domain-containing protein [Actinomycetota bacterium]